MEKIALYVTNHGLGFILGDFSHKTFGLPERSK
jgi:hypothetical protein